MITNELYDNPYNHEIRNYEVSLWTLQDEFITVLKWSDVEHKGTIQDPKLTLADDGTENFTFTIPMYLYERGELKENPIWYTTRNGNLMVNLRKIKIIFNKLKDTERVFELLITKVTEEHEQDHLFCNVECEGLAFHELGKIGYTEVLSAADFELDYKNWQEQGYWTKRDGTKVYSEPIQNVQYWCNARLGLEHIPLNADADIDPRKWYYDIVMQWDSFEKGGVIELDDNNQIVMRDTDKVYEESFVTKWHYDSVNNKLIPDGTENYREKERTVEASESNLYNITQTIAETFGIFCRYIYYHDVNYHISGRKILFFNNFLHDTDIMSLTYPYSSQKVTREMDSTDVVTKLYVKSVENQSTLLGEDSIRYCKANKMEEDYIFNFDYLYETNSITEEQYNAIAEYERNIHEYNEIIQPLQNKLAVYTNQKTELESKITLYTNSAALAQEQINSNQDFITSLLAEHGDELNGNNQYIVSINHEHPDTCYLIPDEQDVYYINLNTRKKGIRADTVRVYRGYTSSNQTLSDEVTTDFSFKYDDYGNPIRIYGIKPVNDKSTVYLTYQYEPQLYYDAIIDYYSEKLANDNDKKIKAAIELGPESIDDIDFDFSGVYSTYAAELSLAHREYSQATTAEKNAVKTAAYNGGLNKKIKDTEEEIERNILEKEKVVAEFNYMMGPALREGNWTPENYQDYGERHDETNTFPTEYDYRLLETDTGDSYSLVWDSKLFDTEQDIFYELGINQNKKAYPCVNLNKIPNEKKAYFWENLSKYSFIFNNHYYEADADTSKIKNIRSFSIGSEAILAFITRRSGSNKTVYPILILVGAKTMTDSATGFENTNHRLDGGTIGFMMNPSLGHPRLGILNTEVEDKNVNVEIDQDSLIELDSGYFTFESGTTMIDYQTVYPRIKFSSLMLKTQDDKFFIHQNNHLLSNYEHYYILNRNIEDGSYAPEIYVTIKPQTFMAQGKLDNIMRIGYTLSNAGTAIYLDAIEIEKENAYPKVSYTVDPNILNKDIISTLYDRLNWLVMINDHQLKLVNTFGYISKLELELDFPDKDTIEIKNYKSKFEDLFSSIVASTESIKSNEALLSSLSAGTYNISGLSLAEAFTNNPTIVNNYLDNYFTNSEVVKGELKDLFLGASEIIADSSQTLDQLQTLTTENATILGSFADKIKSSYTPTIYRQKTSPLTFKRGDTWIEINDSGEEQATYTALCDSSMSSDGYGWNKVHNGSVAQIVGQLNIDAESGKVELLGENMYISGNNSVNIWGPKVNIGSFTYTDGKPKVDAGVFITAKSVGVDETNQTAKTILSEIEVRPELLSIFGGQISLLTGSSKNQSVSAIDLSKNGIYIGSNAGIRLFSGTIYNSETQQLNGTSIELLQEHLLIGASAGNNATAIKITPQMFIATSGTSTVTGVEMTSNIETDGLTGVKASGSFANSLAGVKIASGFFGVVTNNSGNINAMIMNENGLTLAHNLTGIANAGSASLAGASGSYVRLSGSGVTISAAAELNVYANKFNITTGNTTVQFGDAVWLKVKDPHSNGSGSSISISETQLRLQTNTTYIDLQSGALDLHASDENYMTLNDKGIRLEGSNILINGSPIWANDRIKFESKMPDPPAAIDGKVPPWIWIKPNFSQQWAYTTSANFSTLTGRTVSTTLSGDSVSDGNTLYHYIVTCTVSVNTNSVDASRYFSLQLNGAGRTIGWDNYANAHFDTITVPGGSLHSYSRYTLTFNKKFTGSPADVYNVCKNGAVTATVRYSNDSSGQTAITWNTEFNLHSISMTITSDVEATGAFPCTVYYIQP